MPRWATLQPRLKSCAESSSSSWASALPKCATTTGDLSLSLYGAAGGPQALSRQAYYPGSNDSLGTDPTGEAFSSSAMALFSACYESSMPGSSESEAGSHMRTKIVAGEKPFNTAVATITDVRGLNDNPALGSPPVMKGTCTTCHDTPNVGNHSLPLPLDIGISRQAGFESSPGIVAGLE